MNTAPLPTAAPAPEGLLSVRDVCIGYGTKIIQKDISFDVARGSIFAVMGGSGCGKSTLLRSMIGLLRPLEGTYTVDGDDYWHGPDSHRTALNRRFGVLFQSGALWSSMTIGENVALPLEMFTHLDRKSIRQLVEVKLGLVGMIDAIDLYPSEISGGMKKRAGLARAIALDPDVLFFDEPSAGLDPITSARLDDLILTLRDGLGATIVIVSHELSSLFNIADNGIFLDPVTKHPIAHGSPRELRDHCDNQTVHAFMNRQASVTEITPDKNADQRQENSK
ncbi:MAG: ATP-binding cassette domain-containing protein [Acetobacter sp.]|jgi:phospholipid/cholesterol/gamma-HCH transport system ATP-binding protein|nr:ATP-binding cassette domain-containing protein [Acetobacter sp.]